MFMENFTNDYPKILSYVKYHLGNSNLDPNELINEAFLRMCENDEIYSLNTFKKKVMIAGRFLNKKNTIQFNENGKYINLEISGEHKTCLDCKQVFPVSMFYKSGINCVGGWYYLSRCKKCCAELKYKKSKNPFAGLYKKRWVRKEELLLKGFPKIWAKHVSDVEFGFKERDELYNYIML